MRNATKNWRCFARLASDDPLQRPHIGPILEGSVALFLAACRRTLQPVTFLASIKVWLSRGSRSVCHLSRYRRGGRASGEGKHAHELLAARKTGRKRTRATSLLTTSWSMEGLGRPLFHCEAMSLSQCTEVSCLLTLLGLQRCRDFVSRPPVECSV
jgi:hypothetical protein